MIRFETVNSVYLYDANTTTIVCLSGTHAGWVNRNMKLRPVVFGSVVRSLPTSDFFRSTLVQSITLVENEINPHLFN